MRVSLAYLPLIALPVIVAHGLQAGRTREAGNEVRERALALVNAGQQISAAQAIYGIRSGHPATDMSELVERGGLSMPERQQGAGPLSTWRTDGRYAVVSLDGDAKGLCAEISRQAGASRSGPRAGVAAGGDQFGCEPAADGMRFVFRIQ